MTTKVATNMKKRLGVSGHGTKTAGFHAAGTSEGNLNTNSLLEAPPSKGLDYLFPLIRSGTSLKIIVSRAVVNSGQN